MLNSVNQVMLVGHLGRDPEMRTTQAGESVAHLAIATSESWKDKKTGVRNEKTEWHRVVVFGPSADFVGRNFQKGTAVYVRGKLQTQKWQDNAGSDRHSTEVIVTNGGDILPLDGLKQKGDGA